MKDLTYRIEQKISINTELPGPKSTELFTRRNQALPSSVGSVLPGFVVDGDGGILVDADGNQFLDLASGIAVTSAGASNPRVVQAIQDAAARFTHTSFMISPYESYVALAEKLDKLTPGEHDKRTVLMNSGAEAVENAVKIARHYTKKKGVAVFDYAFHGRTNLTMAMTAKENPYKAGFGPFAGDIYRAPMSYPLRDGFSGAEAAERTIAELEKVGADNLACVVIEPIQGEGGFIVPAEGFLPRIVDWCRANDVVFIADEIQAGIMRTGTWFASEHEGIVPDLVTMAKGIGNGMPISAVTGRAEIMNAPQPGGIGGTYGGNPVACAAALATLEEMAAENLGARAIEIGHIVREELAEITEHPRVAELRGRGAMVALEFVDDDGNPDKDLTSAIVEAAKAEGVLVLSCGQDGNVIRFLPPLVIPEALLREGLQTIVHHFTQLV
ncbi:4-aminobutyrate--2-oxoglutarate transaminase [Corynebacterium propinquum]|uniref:4-aminobutyrate--2-oxoglutarate transaminase n=1 Tax=Corynebacterium propinquum TaxID=43769 RepID=UPI0004773922|nr:4-aminobutyrate--2-oxoglutarate transaminase [Corynebacterium propinquum]MCT1818721.1 4-aminobutyrate--2-oxoglutarate transaminase [Corynebacterium propinquum]MDK4239999.1 4-aminobutyrate--2-oxoglutarate transaminase [Corynebacterium propinquum]QQU91719.1 4-aminobutyrate--2-oxoglutarate transaminase [Corynebacterium propinquum]